MGDASEGKRSLGGMEKLSLETNSRFPRDLLQRFMASSNQSRLSLSKEEEDDDESDEIELNLGLSLGGRFGVDKSEKRKLTRSSSIAGCLPVVRDDGDAVAPPPVSHPAALIRTSSLPVETEEEWRKRKELQCLRRMEAKRRRSEKQRNLRSERDSGGGGEIEGSLRGGRSEREQYNRVGLAVVPPFVLPSWAAARHGGSGTGGGGLGFVQPSGSIESQGGSSSGVSESESRLVQGSSSCGEASPSSIQSFQQRSNHEAVGSSSGSNRRENAQTESSPSRRPEVLERRSRETGSNPMDNMPCVFTQGDGPNGKRIEGILYRYGKGEEVRIMCVCHGNFYSPAEFVKHAGGSDVTHPLKHIVVNPSSSTSFS